MTIDNVGSSHNEERLRYVLHGYLRSPEIDVPKEDFDQLAAACTNLLEILNHEEKFVFIIDNFREIEMDVYRNVLVNSSMKGREWAGWVEDIHLFNRRLANLLTTTRLYLDHTRQQLKTVFPDDESIAELFVDLTHSAYDSSFAYRLMEALRNQIQHNSLPIHGLVQTNKVARFKKGDDVAVRSLEFQVRSDLLLSRGNLKSSVAKEIRDLGKDKFDLRPYISDYVKHLFVVHQRIRTEIGSNVSGWHDRVNAVLSRYQGTDESYQWGMVLDHVRGDDLIQRCHLNPKIYPRYLDLVSRYSYLQGLHDDVIASRTDFFDVG